MRPDRVTTVLDGGGDVVVRAGWRNAQWLNEAGEPVSLLTLFRKAKTGLVDRVIWVGRKDGPPLALRLIAIRQSEAAAAARRKARKQARKEGYQLSKEALEAAGWMIVVTSLKAAAFSTTDVLDLCRLRWRIELGFKRLKSLIGLKGPPETYEASAKPIFWLIF